MDSTSGPSVREYVPAIFPGVGLPQPAMTMAIIANAKRLGAPIAQFDLFIPIVGLRDHSQRSDSMNRCLHEFRSAAAIYFVGNSVTDFSLICRNSGIFCTLICV